MQSNISVSGDILNSHLECGSENRKHRKSRTMLNIWCVERVVRKPETDLPAALGVSNGHRDRVQKCVNITDLGLKLYNNNIPVWTWGWLPPCPDRHKLPFTTRRGPPGWPQQSLIVHLWEGAHHTKARGQPGSGSQIAGQGSVRLMCT